MDTLMQFCADCGFASDSAKKFRDHTRLHDKRNLVCSVCDKKLEGKLQLKNHMRKHKGFLRKNMVTNAT